MAKKENFIPKIPFQDFNLEEQIQWLMKQTEKVIKRLPILKKELATYDDKSNEMYNKDASEIQLFTQSYSLDLTTGVKSPSDTDVNDWVEQLSKYGNMGIGDLRLQATEERIDSFLQSLDKSGASELEKEYVQNLLDQMTEQQKEAFTKSKFFWDSGEYGSEGIATFMDMYDVTPATANLENWCEKHGIVTDKLFFTEGDTQYKRGRHKNKGR